MGQSIYSIANREVRAENVGYTTKSVNEIFTEKQINNAMNPYGIKIRESRDSKEHPESIAIVLALDVTGSMGSIPHQLIKEGLPHIIGNIIQKGIKDPQILFLGIGDHEYDNAPLQVSQFESGDELLDKWLTTVYLEGGGGGNNGESYLLAWYFAGFHTAIDCYEKRNQKGFLFTIGDEPVLKKIPGKVLKNLMGDGQYEDYSMSVLLDKAKEKYNIYHLHIREGSNGLKQEVINDWKQILGNNLIVVEKHLDISKIISDIVIKNIGENVKIKIKENKEIEIEKDKKEEIIL